MVDSVKAGTLVVPPVVEQPKPAREILDTPVREKAAAVLSVEEPRERGQDGTAPAASDHTAPLQPSSVLEARNASVATYRDSESGRLIVRIFDKDSGDILVEFPPEDPPLGPSNSKSPEPVRGNTNINA